MKYSNLTEAIIQVPPSLLSKIRLYVSSAICTTLNMRIKNIKYFEQDETRQKQTIEELKFAIGQLQQKYGAKILSDTVYQNLINNEIVLPFDNEKFLNELTIDVTPAIKNKIMNTVIELSVTNESTSSSSGAVGTVGDNSYIIIVNISSLNVRHALKTASDIMATCQHEAQHIIQKMVIEEINPNDKQLKKNYKSVDSREEFAEYLGSYIEYGPHLSDLVNAVELQLELLKLKGELSTESDKNNILNTIFSNVIKDNENYRIFLTTIYKKDKNLYKKALRTIYKYTSPIYDTIVNNDINFAFSDVKSDDIDVNINAMKYVYKKIIKFSEGKIVSANGRDIHTLSKMKIKFDNGVGITLHKEKDQYILDFYYDTYEDNTNINSKELLSFVDEITLFTEQTPEDYYMIFKNLKRDESYSATDISEIIEVSYENIKAFAQDGFDSNKLITTSNSITYNGITMELELNNKGILITSPEIASVYYVVSFNQATLYLSTLIIAAAIAGSDAVITILEDSTTIMQTMVKLGDLL